MCDDAVHLLSLCATEKRKILVQYNLSKVFIKALIALLVEYQSYSSSANLLQFWWVIALISFITKKCPNHSFRELSREYNKTAWLQSSHLKWPMVPQSRDRAGLWQTRSRAVLAGEVRALSLQPADCWDEWWVSAARRDERTPATWQEKRRVPQNLQCCHFQWFQLGSWLCHARESIYRPSHHFDYFWSAFPVKFLKRIFHGMGKR